MPLGLATWVATWYAAWKRSSERRRPISSTIFIGNLSFETTEDELRTVLTDVDPSVRVRLGMDRVTGRPRGFAFAEFSDSARAADAIRRFDAFELRGRRLRVNDADDKPPPRAPRPMSSPSAPMAMPSEPLDMRNFGGGEEAPFARRGRGSRRGLRARKRSLRW
jgi:RNA recognition motif-containing protein